MFDIPAGTMERVSVNRVRFRMGYGDSDEQPLPGVAPPLRNPVHRALQNENSPPRPKVMAWSDSAKAGDIRIDFSKHLTMLVGQPFKIHKGVLI